jgi:hypothetical protein
MTRSRRLMLTPLALAAAVGWGMAVGAPPGQTAQPWGPAGAAHSAGKQPDSGHWNERFQGSGNVTQTRCLGMTRGANCITAASRKDAARRRAAAASAAEQEASAAPASDNPGHGGKKK